MQALGFDKVWVDENGSVVGVIEGTQPGKTLLFDREALIAKADAEGITIVGAPPEE